MIEMTPTTDMSHDELEAWFASAGVTVEIVARCPVTDCSVCLSTALSDAA